MGVGRRRRSGGGKARPSPSVKHASWSRAAQSRECEASMNKSRITRPRRGPTRSSRLVSSVGAVTAPRPLRAVSLPRSLTLAPRLFLCALRCRRHLPPRLNRLRSGSAAAGPSSSSRDSTAAASRPKSRGLSTHSTHRASRRSRRASLVRHACSYSSRLERRAGRVEAR